MPFCVIHCESSRILCIIKLQAFEGFVNFGNGIVAAANENTVATGPQFSCRKDGVNIGSIQLVTF